jgi:peptidoglycan glycosyltransferase
LPAALLVRCTPSYSHADASLPDARALRLGRAVAVAAVLLVAVLSASRISADRMGLNRRADSPLRGWINQNRGPIVSRDGTTLAFTTGAGSLDTVDRRHREAALTAGIVGRVTYANQNGGGIENGWRALLRCGGSGQARASGESWSRGAARIEGDPARCKPEGLRTSLDLPVQRAATAALADVRGAIVVLDGRTGAVLAAAGRVGAETTATTLAAFDLLVAPGSTFKIVTAAAALESGIATETPFASGFAAPAGRWLSNAGGEMCGGALRDAFAQSCNSSFARLGVKIGADRIIATAARFGFGSPVAVSGIPSATSSLNAAEGMGPDLLASSSIGQGAVAATPLQMALVVATVANGGRRPTPTLVDGICGKESVTTSTRRVLSTQTARTIGEAMRAVTLDGTGRGAASVPGMWALKTGTAEVPRLSQAGTSAGTAAWIVGYPTTPLKSGVLPVVAGVILPDAANPLRSGPRDGVGVVAALAPAALSAHGTREACD